MPEATADVIGHLPSLHVLMPITLAVGASPRANSPHRARRLYKKREVHCELLFQYSEPGSNRHGHYWPQDFKSGVSTYSTIRATQPLRRCKCSVFILFCQIFCAFLRYIVAFSCCAPACRNYLGGRRVGNANLSARSVLCAMRL